MIMEHVAINVPDPHRMVEWYIKELGMKFLQKANEYTYFIADEKENTIMEIYHNPQAPVLPFQEMDPLMLHFAFLSDDLEKDTSRLVQAGATVFRDIVVTKGGDSLIMLKDPWGIAIQLVKRAEANRMKK